MPEAETNPETDEKQPVTSFHELQASLTAMPEFLETRDRAVEMMREAAKALGVPPILIAQCLFNVTAKAVRGEKT